MKERAAGGEGLKKNFFAIGLVVVCLLLTACHIVPDAAKDGAGGYTVTDSQGTVVTVPARPQSICRSSSVAEQISIGITRADISPINEICAPKITSASAKRSVSRERKSPWMIQGEEPVAAR